MPRTLIFGGGQDGFGDARLPDGVTPETNRRYHKAYNAYLQRGPFVPDFRQYTLSSTIRVQSGTSRAVDWTESGKKGINRALYYGYGPTVFRFSNGAETGLFSVSNASIVDMIAWEDGSSNGALICSFGADAFLQRMDDSGSETASTDVKAGYMAMAGPDLYAQTDAGTYSTYKVSKLPKGNDPKTASNWGSGEPVGSAAYKITGLAGFDIGPAVGKEEGLFIFDEQEGSYRNFLPFLERNPHPDNGKGMTAVAGGVLYPTHDGGLWFCDGFSVINVTPLAGATTDRDTPKGKVVAMAETGRTIFVALDSFYQQSFIDGAWPKVFLFDDSASAFTDDTANLTDNDLGTTGSDLSLFDDSGDLWYFGFESPIEAIHVIMDTPSTTAGAGGAKAYSNKSGGFTTGTFHDATRTNAAGILAQDGSIVISVADNMINNMGKVTINGQSAYWFRFAPTTVSAGTKIAEVRVTPARADMALGSLDHTSYDHASGLTHILAGVRTDRGIIWHDRFALEMGGSVTFLALSATDIDEEDNGGLALIVGSFFFRKAIVLNQTDNPIDTVLPRLNSHANGFPETMLQMPRMELGDEDDPRPRSIERFDVEGEYLQSADTLTIVMRLDRNKWEQADILNQLPGSAEAPAGNMGHVLDWAMALTDTNSTEHAAPRVNKVWAVWDYVGERDKYPGVTPQIAEQTPEIE